MPKFVQKGYLLFVHIRDTEQHFVCDLHGYNFDDAEEREIIVNILTDLLEQIGAFTA